MSKLLVMEKYSFVFTWQGGLASGIAGVGAKANTNTNRIFKKKSFKYSNLYYQACKSDRTASLCNSFYFESITNQSYTVIDIVRAHAIIGDTIVAITATIERTTWTPNLDIETNMKFEIWIWSVPALCTDETECDSTRITWLTRYIIYNRISDQKRTCNIRGVGRGVGAILNRRIRLKLKLERNNKQTNEW